MNSNSSQDDKKPTLTLGAGKLSLSKSAVESGQIRQNFAHGRSKTVTVEVKRTRSLVVEKPKDKVLEVVDNNVAIAEKAQAIEVDDHAGSLTEYERTTRLSALQKAAKMTEIEKQEQLRRQELAKKEEEAQALAKANAPEVEEQVVENLPEQQSAISSTEEVVKKKPHTSVKATEVEPDSDELANKLGKKIIKVDNKTPAKPRYDEVKRGKISVTAIGSDEEEWSGGRRGRSMASIKRAREKARRLEMNAGKESEKIVREVVLPEVISVQELASRMAEKSSDVIRELMKLGIMANVNQDIDADTAELVIGIFGHKIKRVTDADVENILVGAEDDEASMEFRAPVVTVMGHVDHGKTSLLDALKSTDVAAGEAGGITQHIGAYRIKLASGEYITFLDTPGHEAFTAMRLRGAKATDIVVLVVAADDGIMAQTIEALNHAKAAGVPIIVAINKIDKPAADPDRVRNELLSHGLVPEELGGDTMVVEVSAKQKLNLEKLEEAILLQAEVLDLKANPHRLASGVVIESKIDKGRGVVATVLVQRGTLNPGEILVAGATFGRVKVIHDDKGHNLKHATPSMPVEVLGLSQAPEAGDSFSVVQTEKQARDICEYRMRKSHAIKTTSSRMSLDEMFLRASGNTKLKELPVIIKADVQGSIEAISGSICKLANDEISVKILHSAVGGITESDVTLSMASNAIILGFNVRANTQAKLLADREKVDIRYYSIIYNLVDDIKAALSGMLSPILREEYLGSVEIRQVFNITKSGKVAGSFVTAGIVKKGAKVRLLRDNIVIHEGKLKTLKRFKDDVREVREGYECGIAFENYEDIREKDTVEVFEIVEEAQTL